MLTTSRWILRIMNMLNWIAGIAILLALGALAFVFPSQMADSLSRSDPALSAETLLVALRWVVIITAPIILLVHILFTRLIAMIDSVPGGNALSLVNADRLRTIAWALIGINLLDLAYGAVAMWADFSAGDGASPFEWTFSLTGWLAALMLFILAQVFREGAAMRDELEGTV
ncbi:DUF2975 domain-containing protein [Sphingomonas lacunae]|uniref:DUF2975 domain-containing protein n=1 Tax=Sphingomonas lacunae TaxID=2698828 RepID=A0A6M4AT06_9SPHN|nr:DUF2975 domain-containing protein [Sphingomonas lacunae]QJQ32194.1 DUF2975 domain-containing protein [Sphingomonas lacunae]